ncbi:MAG: NUDIX hydrolase [bacterium]|nr:NUDIX hydrolase [bacterium]
MFKKLRNPTIRFLKKILELLGVKQISVGVFIVAQDPYGRYLFVKHGYGMKKWSLPGGGLERGEFVSDAGTREAFEESGLKVKVKRYIGHFSLKKSDGLVLLYKADILGEAILHAGNGREITACKFFSKEQAYSLNRQRYLYDAQMSAILWSEMPPRSDGLPHEGWLTVPPTLKS